MTPLKRLLIGLALACLPLAILGAVIQGGGGGVANEVDTLLTVTGRGFTTSPTSESVQLRILGTGAQALYGAYAFQHSDGNFHFDCFTATGLNKCSYYRIIDAGFFGGYKDSSNNILFDVDPNTGNTTFNDEKHFRVAACNNATASSVFDLPTANAPEAVCEGTNTRMATLDFNDTTDESFADSWTLPSSFKGKINVHGRWKAAATSGSVAWCAQLVRVPDAATSDPALPAQATGNCVSDAAKGTTLQENDFTISGVTCTSCVAGDRVNVVISRDPNETSTRTDNMAGDAKLITYGRTIR